MGNFMALATGTRPWMEVGSGRVLTRPFYDGLLFHRVIAGFMIQTGSPNGGGAGGPGYVFPDAFDPALRHDGPGVLSMANSGPNSNGSQFFITVAATPWLDDVHTVFGRVVEGYAVVQAISQVPTDDLDQPRETVRLQNVRIRRVGPAAEAFDVHAQDLPEVIPDIIRTRRSDGGLTFSFDRPIHADLRLRESTNLNDWSSSALGIDLEPAAAANFQRSTDGLAWFVSLTRIQYPSSTFAPRSLANRALVLTFNGGVGTVAIEFDAAGGGVYTFDSGNDGTITGLSWLQEVYRGRLSLSTSSLVPMVLRLDFADETEGKFAGTAQATPPFSVAGTFTLTRPAD